MRYAVVMERAEGNYSAYVQATSLTGRMRCMKANTPIQIGVGNVKAR